MLLSWWTFEEDSYLAVQILNGEEGVSELKSMRRTIQFIRVVEECEAPANSLLLDSDSPLGVCHQ